MNKKPINSEDFVDKMLDSDYIYDELDLREFAEEHLQNQLTYEENLKLFFEFIGEEQ